MANSRSCWRLGQISYQELSIARNGHGVNDGAMSLVASFHFPSAAQDPSQTLSAGQGPLGDSGVFGSGEGIAPAR